MAANIADLALTSSVETIRRKEIRLVGIAASDPRDILFLARKIRETGANVTLFTFGADILYTHPDYERYLRGMLVVTPYPLFPANQAWSDVTAVQVAFAGSTEEGIYNAMLTLVPPPPPASVHPLIEYQAPMQPARRKPPIWIMAVGRNGFWPVAIAPNYRDKDHVLANSSRLSPAPGPEGYRPPGAILAYVLLEFLFIGVIASYLTLRRPAAAPRELEATPDRRSTIPRGLVNRAETILSIWSTTPAREINGTYLATLLTLIALVQATLALCVWRTKEFQHHATALLAGALFMLACLLGLAVREWIRLFRGVSPKSEKGLAWRHARVPVAILAGVGLLLVPYWAEICALDVANVVPFFARALDLTSTLSPVLPFMLVFLVLALWAFCNMERAFLLEVQCDEGLEPGSSAALAGLQELQTAIRNLLADPNSRTFTLLVPILAFVPFYRLVGQPFDSIDGSRWSRLFEFCLLACYFVIVHSVTLFVTLWLRVRRLLQRLSWHPVAEAFQRLPESVAASPWRMLRPVQSLTGLEVSVSQLWTLVHLGRGRLDEDYRKQLELRAQAAQTLLDLAVDESSRSFAGSLPTQRELRTSLAEVTARLLEALEEAWRQGPGPRGARIEPRRVDAEQRFASVPDWLRGDVPGPSALWVRAAEEFVALHFFSYLRGVFLQIKNVLSFAFLGFVLAIAAVNSYPFQPKHPVMALIWIVALVCLALVAWAFIEMDRDRILSYIGKTTPGQTTLSREFLSSMAIYVLVPLLTLLATQFPALGEFIFSVFSPAMKSLR
jgi:hypothetical protein